MYFANTKKLRTKSTKVGKASSFTGTQTFWASKELNLLS